MFTPSDRATRNFIAVAHEDAEKLFGNLPVIVVPPRVTRDEQDQSWLPPVRFIADFLSEPFDADSCYSEAVVIWFQQDKFPFISKEVNSDLESIDWEKSAKNITML